MKAIDLIKYVTLLFYFCHILNQEILKKQFKKSPTTLQIFLYFLTKDPVYFW